MIITRVHINTYSKRAIPNNCMRKILWYHYYLLYILGLLVISIIVLQQNYGLMYSVYIVLLIFLTGTYNQQISFDNLTVLNILAVSGLLTQLFILVIFITLSLRYIFVKEERLNRMISFITFNLPIKQILLGLFLSFSILATVIFKFVEEVSWMDSIYFVFVTITTVGYGDLVATHPFTKIITIILIFNGISFIGIASQYVVDRIIKLQLETQHNVPSESINMHDHIIIAGFGMKARKLVELFIGRGYNVVVVEKDLTRTSANMFSEVLMINGDITKPNILNKLSLDRAAGLFLLLSNDDVTIQTGIVARSISQEVDIYAELTKAPTYKIARYAGINHPISLYHNLINVLRANLFRKDITPMETVDNMKTYESKLGYLLVPMDFEREQFFEEIFEIGFLNLNLNEFSINHHPNYFEKFDSIDKERSKAMQAKTHRLIAVEKEELISKSKLLYSAEKISHQRVIFAGYHPFIDEFIKRLHIGNENIIILWQNDKEKELLEGKEYMNYEWTIDNGIDLLERLVKDDDLIICTFEDITSSMLLAVTVNNTKKNTYLIQITPYEVEIEPFVHIGAERVITPQRIIADALLSSFIKTNHLSPSFVFTDAHVFEHLVFAEDRYDERTVEDLLKSNIIILLINKIEEGRFRETVMDDLIRANDRLVIYVGT